MAGLLYTPMPIRVAAAMLTEYVTLFVKLASKRCGEDASTDILARMCEMFMESKLRIMI